MLNIEDYAVKSAEVTVPLLNLKGVTVTLAKISSEQILDIRSKCILGKKFDKATKQWEETLDNDKFLTLYADAVIKDWNGFKGKHLKQLLLINLPDDKLEEDVPCTSENKVGLLRKSSEVDDFVTQVISDVAIFNQQIAEQELGK